ncbi:sodium:proton exchanger [Curtobacterium sp. MCLR17_036]|uniref:sodium:proton exchanger n=1 Tax=Curtobacterium sp. MCLR17_036 TaxID=2175620 RepID=UPI0024DFAF08|nr:sodium:proton exchanger [Curtobacterium sp. MCLR17_036]WIE65377.1 sodium:proton exchanger [Curtobacterium sp. MCLR17_036]
MTDTLSTSTSTAAAPATRMGASAWGRVAICVVLALPAVVFRLGGLAPNPVVDLFVFGGAVVAAAFLLAWAAEAAQKDISGALAIAILALIAVLPEYAVDLYYAFRSGYDPAYEQFAAANMTGSNRLLLGFGWPLVVIVSLLVARRFVREGSMPAAASRVLELERSARLDVGFLALLAVVAFLIPLMGSIPMWFGFVLLAVFVVYLWRASQVPGGDDEDLPGMAGNIASMPRGARRWTIVLLFAAAATIVLTAAEPFADALVESGSALGIDSYFLVQWLAPLATEAPEFIVAVLFALRGMGGAAIGTLIASKINQWSLLVGSLPIAHVLGGGTSGGLPLDSRQVEEFVLTASQTVLGVAIIIALRFHRWSAIALVALFAVQFVVTDTSGRWVLSTVHLVAAVVVFWNNRREIGPTLAAPFRRPRVA